MTSSLLSRLQSLTGPDREIDAEIALAFGWTHTKLPRDGRAYWRKPGVTDWWDRVSNGPPRYTASIDAALMLLPDETPWQMQTSPNGSFNAYVWDVPGESNATPAIALCIAFEKAKEESKNLPAPPSEDK